MQRCLYCKRARKTKKGVCSLCRNGEKIKRKKNEQNRTNDNKDK